MNVEMCRVCLEPSKAMVNIFDEKGSISVADMISECTGFYVYKGDSLPENICPPCLQDAKNAFDIKQLYEKSHWFYCQIQKDLQEEEDQLEESSEISDCEDSGTYNDVKQEEFGEIDESRRDELEVKNEPIEEDLFDQIDFQVKTEEIEDPFQIDDQCSANSIDSDDKSTVEQLLTSRRYPYKCSHCQKSFRQKSSLKRHMVAHTGKRTFKCSHCEKSFSLKLYLERHMFTHAIERQYKCSHCQKTFKQERILQIHKKIHAGDRPHKCPHCPKSFRMKHHLSSHLVTHTWDRLKKCYECGKSFFNLLRHVRIHSMERPFQCPHCQKSFLSNQALRRHILTHTGEKPYKCWQCPKNFSQNANLQRHIRTHTDDRKYQCFHCNWHFSQKVHLQYHMQSKHSVEKTLLT